MPILLTNGLSKKYGRIRAVDTLSLRIEKGNIYGLLGPNGSGKTTTLGMVLGVIQPDEGNFEWFDGKFGKYARKNIGALLETPNFYPYMSAVQNLEIIAHIKKIKEPKIEEALDLVQLLHRKDSPFKTYSLGMKQRLAIAASMIGSPEVLVFDEPTNGLDPQGIADVREAILNIAQEGKTIIMASHILDEVEKICSHVAIIKKGKLLATGTVGAILSHDLSIELKADDMDALMNFIRNIPEILDAKRENGMLFLTSKKDISMASLNEKAFAHGIVLTHIVAKQKSLESEFLEITREY